jgi:DNA-binding IclR family transcriptional regulator
VAFTGATITDQARLEREFAQVRKRGWALRSGSCPRPSISIAAPIVDRRDAAVGAIAIFGRPERLLNARKPRGNLLGYVREAARRVQGARGDPLVILGERAKDQSRDTAAAEQPYLIAGAWHY